MDGASKQAPGCGGFDALEVARSVCLGLRESGVWWLWGGVL